jgi:hypothetical protein
MKAPLRSSLVLAVTLVAACDDASSSADDAAPAPTLADAAPAPIDATPADAGAVLFHVEGSVTGDYAPASGTTVVAWAAGPRPEDVYIYGLGSQSGDGFHVELRDPMPAEHLLRDGLGVGMIALFADGQEHPVQGPWTFTELSIGGSGRHAIVYRAPGTTPTTYAWAAAFPEGFSCGVCADGEGGKQQYVPTDCATVQILAPEEWLTSDVCLWQ